MLSRQLTGEVVNVSKRNAGEKSYLRVAHRLTTLEMGDGWGGTEDSRKEHPHHHLFRRMFVHLCIYHSVKETKGQKSQAAGPSSPLEVGKAEGTVGRAACHVDTAL